VPSARPGSRRTYLDAARGLAVLLMIGWHTIDAWTRIAERRSPSFNALWMLAGFAAPLFLWLAGVATALTAERLKGAGARPGAIAEVICRRGLELFVLAFLFRLQAFIVTPGSHPVTIFRVDILNVMGPAIALCGLVWLARTETTGIAVLQSTIALTIALVAPIAAVAPLDMLPLWFQWYLRPAGDLTAFTLLPWAGFVFAGAACGAVLAIADDQSREARTQLIFAAVGIALIVLGDYTASRPTIYARSTFWSNSPTWFAMRIGIMMTGVAIVYALARATGQWRAVWYPLERFGRSSLFVYWIHVELVYGYATWPLRRHLPLWGSLVAFLIFSALMYGAIGVRDRILARVRMRALARTTARTASA
jgi:uncharacterized membrane protein